MPTDGVPPATEPDNHSSKAAPVAPPELEAAKASEQALATELLETAAALQQALCERDDVVRALELASRAQELAIDQRNNAIKERDDLLRSQDGAARLFDAQVAAGIYARTDELRQRYDAVEQKHDAAEQEVARLRVANARLDGDLTNALTRITELEGSLAAVEEVPRPQAFTETTDSPFKAVIAPRRPDTPVDAAVAD